MAFIKVIGRALVFCWKKLWGKGPFYWITVVGLIVVGVWVGEKLEGRAFAIKERYELYQIMTRRNPDRAYVERTVLVLISDEEFWRGDLANRIPLNRDYLERLLTSLKAADPTVIALDLNFTSPMPDGSLNFNCKYAKETENFLTTVKNVSEKIPIVLPKTVRFANGYFFKEADEFDGFNFGNGKVSFGHVILPSDYRQVPLTLIMKDGYTVPSFAEAIVSIDNSEALKTISATGKPPFGYYLREHEFGRVFAREVINADAAALEKLHHKIVIVGGAWSLKSYGRGDRVDTRFTPAGPLPGAYMHANFVESLLHRRTYEPLHKKTVIAIDMIVSLILAILFALMPPFPSGIPLIKFGINIVIRLFVTGFIVAVLFLLSYASWRNLGLFYDSFIPGILVIGHGSYEQISEWASASWVKNKG